MVEYHWKNSDINDRWWNIIGRIVTLVIDGGILLEEL